MWVDLEDVFYQLKSLFFPPFALHSRSYSRLWQSIPGNGNGNTKLHSQILGTGTGMKNSIPNFWEREREWKNHSQFSGTGMGGRYSREWPGTGIPAHPCNHHYKFIADKFKRVREIEVEQASVSLTIAQHRTNTTYLKHGTGKHCEVDIAHWINNYLGPLCV